MQNYLDDTTICAISTPHGVGGIAVIRVSGPQAIAVCDAIWRGRALKDAATHTAHLGYVLDSQGEQLDQAVATVFRAPHSFTGQDVVEFSVHGSVYVQRELLHSLCAAGAVMAQPGEFTRRAFSSGRLDLAEAEAVADIIASTSRASHRLAICQMRGDLTRRLALLREALLEVASLLELELDFSEEDVEFASRQKLLNLVSDTEAEIVRLERSFASGSAIRAGIPVAIVGATNVGKSSLLNALADDERAIVSDIHGTTRDIIDDTVTIGDYTFRLLDTAGIRHSDDPIERLGMDRSLRAMSQASVIMLVIDASSNVDDEKLVCQAIEKVESQDTMALVAVINKTDLAVPDAAIARLEELIEYNAAAEVRDKIHIISVSAAQRRGIDELRALLNTIAAEAAGDRADVVVTSERHRQALADASRSLKAVIDGLRDNLSGDFIAQDLREALHYLGQITGTEITTPEILSSIFSRFCIGK